MKSHSLVRSDRQTETAAAEFSELLTRRRHLVARRRDAVTVERECYDRAPPPELTCLPDGVGSQLESPDHSSLALPLKQRKPDVWLLTTRRACHLTSVLQSNSYSNSGQLFQEGFIQRTLSEERN